MRTYSTSEELLDARRRTLCYFVLFPFYNNFKLISKKELDETLKKLSHTFLTKSLVVL